MKICRSTLFRVVLVWLVVMMSGPVEYCLALEGCTDIDAVSPFLAKINKPPSWTHQTVVSILKDFRFLAETNNSP